MKQLFLLLSSFIAATHVHSQNVGIGTTSPNYKLHIVDTGSSLLKLESSKVLNSGISNGFLYKTGSYYTGAIKTVGTGSADARLGLFTNSSVSEGSLLERLSILNDGKIGIGTTTPFSTLHVVSNLGYPLIVDGGNQMFITLAEGGLNRGYIGSYSGADEDVDFGTYSGNSTGKIHFTMQNVPKMTITPSGYVGIGNINPQFALDVTSNNLNRTCYFVNTASYGTGVSAIGTYQGLDAYAATPGSGNHTGVFGDGANGDYNYGVFGLAAGGITACGILGNGSGGWGGYFVGDVYTTGSYLPSDRKLKNNIQPVGDAMPTISKLNPCSYTYKKNDFQHMQLPDGIHYGLIADEVKSVFPGLVKKTIQPPEYENHDALHGKKLSDAVEFEAINYTELIPLLIAGLKEMQTTVENQNIKIDLQQQVINKLLADIQSMKSQAK